MVEPGYNTSAESFQDDFINYLFNRKDVKALAAAYIHHILSDPSAKIEAAKAPWEMHGIAYAFAHSVLILSCIRLCCYLGTCIIG